MIHKAHTLDFDTMKPWPPDADLPTPAQDLDALYQVVKDAWEAYMDAVRQWEHDREQNRLQAWKTYHDGVGWPKSADYKTRIEAELAILCPAAAEPAVEEK